MFIIELVLVNDPATPKHRSRPEVVMDSTEIRHFLDFASYPLASDDYLDLIPMIARRFTHFPSCTS